MLASRLPRAKTGQKKVQSYCEDDSLCPSCYIIFAFIYGGASACMQEIEDTGKKGGKILYVSKENFFLEF